MPLCGILLAQSVDHLSPAESTLVTDIIQSSTHWREKPHLL